MSSTTKTSPAVFHTGAKVVELNETTSDEAAELFRALANASPTPEAVALDHLMDDDARPAHEV